MTENSDRFLEEPYNSDPPEAVLLELSPELSSLLHQRSLQLRQSPVEVILSVLRSALESPLVASNQFDLLSPESTTVRSIQDRLNQLEALLPRLEVLEGKWMAF